MLKRRCIGLNRPIQPRKVRMPMRVPMRQNRENRRRCIGEPMHRGIPSCNVERSFVMRAYGPRDFIFVVTGLEQG